jgi:hypothetical protein
VELAEILLPQQTKNSEWRTDKRNNTRKHTDRHVRIEIPHKCKACSVPAEGKSSKTKIQA